MKGRIVAIVAASLWAATPLAHAQAPIKVGITPAGQPASGLNSETKKPEGFAVEILQAVAADAGLGIRFEPMPFGELQQALLDRKIDVIAGSFGITPERQKVVDFTHPYGSYRDVLIVKASDPAAYTSVADLKGAKIATSRGSSYVKPLEAAGAQLSLSATPPDSIAALQAGTVDGIVDNGLQLNFLLRSADKANFRTVPSYQPILVGYLAFAVRKGDADLQATIDHSLSKLEASGTVASIKARWGLE